MDKIFRQKSSCILKRLSQILDLAIILTLNLNFNTDSSLPVLILDFYGQAIFVIIFDPKYTVIHQEIGGCI